jgi:hypothetical protein
MHPPPFTKRYLLFYCSYTPQKVIWELLNTRGVFFGVSSFGRFGRRVNQISAKVSYTPSVTLSLQESVIASPTTLEQRHHPFDAQRAAADEAARVPSGLEGVTIYRQEPAPWPPSRSLCDPPPLPSRKP